MSKEFEIAREFEVDATPDQVWDAVTSGTGGWLWPMEPPEPREGGRGPWGSTVTAWDPPHQYTNRLEGVDENSAQTLNQLDYTVEPRDGGRRAWVRYVHSGIFVDDWDNQYDGASRHTDFYLHTLREYLTRFAARPAAFATFDGPEASKAADAFAAVGRALGLADDTAEGARVRAQGPDGPGPGRRRRLPQPVLHRAAHRRRPHPLLRTQPLGRTRRHERPRLRPGRRRQGERGGLAGLAEPGLRSLSSSRETRVSPAPLTWGRAHRRVPAATTVSRGDYGRNRSTCGSWSLIWSENSELMCTLSYVKSQSLRIDGLIRIWSRTWLLPW